ncbi:MAG: hypothetical protein F6K47_06010 [Symploca sp. SIO2E6]|nr:hypothetical protein [Symploca sp. SIO2E6]
MMFRQVPYLVGLTALTVVSSTMSASAETPSLDSAVEVGQYEDNSAEPNKPDDIWFRRSTSSFQTLAGDLERDAGTRGRGDAETPELASYVVSESSWESNLELDAETQEAPDAEQFNFTRTVSGSQQTGITPVSQEIKKQDYFLPTNIAGIKEYPVNSPESKVVEPMPGTLDTSAALLTVEPKSIAEPLDTTVAQRDLDLRRTPRPVPNWIGIGGNIGLSDDNDEESALGRGAFMVNAKLNLVRNISFRPAVLIADNTTFLLPATYDFVIPAKQPFERIKFAPFVGGGAAFSTGDNSSVGFLLTGGVEFPISRQFVANGSISIGFLETTDLGIQLGVGYLFSEFLR